MNNKFAAYQREGKEWGVFHAPTRKWIVFGGRNAMIYHARVLNAQHPSATTTQSKSWRKNKTFIFGK